MGQTATGNGVRFGTAMAGAPVLLPSAATGSWPVTDTFLPQPVTQPERAAQSESPISRLFLAMIRGYQHVTRDIPVVRDVWHKMVRCIHYEHGETGCSNFAVEVLTQMPAHVALEFTAKHLLTCSPLYFLQDKTGFGWVKRWVDETRSLEAAQAAYQKRVSGA